MAVTKAEWDTAYKEICALRQKALEALGNDGMELYERSADFSAVLAQKYSRPEMESYMAFHILGRSTCSYEKSPHIDFPGEHSVKAFYQRIIDNPAAATNG